MRIRKYAGVILGFVLSLGIASSVLANTIGPNNIYNQGPGWNSEIWNAGSGTTSFQIRYCQSSANSVKFDQMHHWPFFPSTGTAEKTLSCVYGGSWVTASWNNGAATYSIEYTHNNVATITLTYQIIYPAP